MPTAGPFEYSRRRHFVTIERLRDLIVEQGVVMTEDPI